MMPFAGQERLGEDYIYNALYPLKPVYSRITDEEAKD